MKQVLSYANGRADIKFDSALPRVTKETLLARLSSSDDEGRFLWRGSSHTSILYFLSEPEVCVFRKPVPTPKRCRLPW